MATTAQLGGAAAATTAAIGGGGYGISLVVNNGDSKNEAQDDNTITKDSQLIKKKHNSFSRFKNEDSSLQDTISQDSKQSTSPTKKTTKVTKKTLTKPDHVSVFGSTDRLEGYTNKILDWTNKEHLNFLVKPLEQSNQKWWEWLYEKVYVPKTKNNKNGLDSIFKNLTLGFSSKSSSQSLNQACDKAYKQDKERYTFPTNHLLKNIGQFCTNSDSEEKDIVKPRVFTYEGEKVVEADYAQGLLSKENNRQHLVKDIKENELWWNWLFFSNSIWRGSKGSFPLLFQGTETGYSAQLPAGEKTKPKSLNKACDEAYKKNIFRLKEGTNTIFDKVKEYCVVKKNSLTLPDMFEPANPVTLKNTKGDKLAKHQDNLHKLVANVPENKDWWEWSFSTRFPKANRSQLPVSFSTVNGAYNTVGTNYLNAACEKAYENDIAYEGKDKKYLNNKTVLQWVKELCSPTTALGELILDN